MFAEKLPAKAAATGAQMSPWASTLEKTYSCDHYSGSPTREFGAFSPGRNGRSHVYDCGHQEAMFAEELAAKAAAAGAQMSPWACTLGKSYTCDQYSGPPTREFGAFSPGRNGRSHVYD